MKKKVFISACSFRAPGLKNFEDIINAMNDRDFEAPFKKIVISDKQKTFIANLKLDKSSIHYPLRSNLKVLRSDVIAAIICSGELLDQAGLSVNDMLDVPLYISNGACFDLSIDQVAEITEAYLPKTKNEESSNRYQRVNVALHPLFVLKTLSNATECFVSQKVGAKGDNTTFGSSSHSTYYALLEGKKKIENNESEMALVGASSGIEVFSVLIYKNFISDGFNWRESEGAGFLLLETEESCKRSGRKPLAQIVTLDSSKNIPDLFTDGSKDLPYQNFNQNLAENCIYSGGLTENDCRIEEKVCKNNWADTFTWYNKLGIMGNNAVIMNIATSIALFNQKKIEQIDCLNRDPYGRESLIKLKSCES